ncbi:endopeptidase La [Alicyclobacillaceae bacterium I2511]|nr:endopeptidase La [Alicyclobacillaceae bacterium I2511]
MQYLHTSGGIGMSSERAPLERTYPLLPLRGLLVFPGMVIHFDVGRDKSVRALEKAMVQDHYLVLASQQDGQVDDPRQEDLFGVGVLAEVKQMMKLPNGTLRVLVEGLERSKIQNYVRDDEYFEVQIQRFFISDSADMDPELRAVTRTVLQQFEQYAKLSKKIDQETYGTVVDIEDPGRLADAIAAQLPLKIKEKQEILESFNVSERLDRVLSSLADEREVLELEKEIHQRVRKQMEKTQKEYYLREQMKAIQRELGDKEGRQGEIDELRDKMANLQLPELVAMRVDKEINRLERIPISSAEGTVARTFIDWLLDLPWTAKSVSIIDLGRAQRVLDAHHYGLEKVKDRIIDYLAVQKLTQRSAGPIICLVGPPGVGKTSLVKSVAEALKRPFVRISLGGVRDEAEIRGHRRTYIGALPGRIIQGMKEAGVRNPVFLMDEIDKMANDFRGDPASALLEVLDPEQNFTFVDHYIDLPFDLSDVMFVTTANDLYQIPGPLRDRMEIIQLSGYTELEKLEIAEQHLLPKQKIAHALKGERLKLNEDVILEIIRGYSREAGVRQLDRLLATVARKTARQVAEGKKKRVQITVQNLPDYLGPAQFNYGAKEEYDEVGVVTGLAWTPAGGDTLTIEVAALSGKGKVVLTGQLGDVMKESAQTALSFVRSRSRELLLDNDFIDKTDIHVHVPEGAIPKDGPSAGITMATAIASCLTRRPVRHDVAMTGEITLRGRVLPIGGLKEKSLAAHRVGIRSLIVPEGNRKDVLEIPKSVRDELEIVFVRQMDDVLKRVLLPAVSDAPSSLEVYPGFTQGIHEDYPGQGARQ